MQKFKIIPITEAYIDSFRVALGSVAREGKFLSFLDEPPVEMTRTFVMENIKDNWPHYIALYKTKVIGWCDITSLHRPIFSHVGVLGIGVLAGYRGCGIGKHLMQTALNRVKEKGLTRIELTVRENNTSAIALYKKFGFQVEGLHRNAVRIGKEYENQLTMELLY